MNYFNKIVGGMTAPNQSQEEIKAELEKRKKQVTNLQEKLKKKTDQYEFATKAFEQTEKRFEQFKKNIEIQNIQFKKNTEHFSTQLQNVPNTIISTLTTSLLQKLNEHLGEAFEQQEIKSFLDLDFNYKTVFAEYIGQIFELTKQKMREGQKSKQENEKMEMKLNMKDKQIEEIVDKYQANIKALEKEFSVKLSNKIEEFNIVKEQKDFLIKDLSEGVGEKNRELQELKNNLTKVKSSESNLKIQKQKNQAKLYEQCQMYNQLLYRTSQFQIETKQLKERNDKIVISLTEQNQKLKKEMQQLRVSMKQMENNLNQMETASMNYSQKINKATFKRVQTKNKIKNIKIDQIKTEIQHLKQFVRECSQKNSEELQQVIKMTQFQNLINQFRNSILQQLEGSSQININNLIVSNSENNQIEESEQRKAGQNNLQGSQNIVQNKSNQKIEQLQKNEEKQRSVQNSTLIVNQSNRELVANLQELEELQRTTLLKNEQIQKLNRQIQQLTLSQKFLTEQFDALQQTGQAELQRCKQKVQVLGQDIKDKIAQIEQKNIKLNSLEQQITALKSQIETYKQNKQKYDRQHSQNQVIFQDSVYTVAALQQEIQLQRQKIIVLTNENAEIKRVNSTYQQQNESKAQQIDKLKMENESMTHRLKEKDLETQNTQNQIIKLREINQNATLVNQQLIKSKEIIELTNSQLSNSIIEFTNKNQQLAGTNEQSKKQLSYKNNELQDFKIKLKEMQRNNSQLEWTVTLLQQSNGKKILQLQRNIKQLQEKTQHYKQELKNKQQQLIQFKNTINSKEEQLRKVLSQVDQLFGQINDQKQSYIETVSNYVNSAEAKQRQWSIKTNSYERDLQQKQRLLAQKNNQKQRLQETIKILNQNANSQEGETNNSLQLINDLQLKYKQEITNNHELINQLQKKINQMEQEKEETKCIIIRQSKQRRELQDKIEYFKTQLSNHVQQEGKILIQKQDILKQIIQFKLIQQQNQHKIAQLQQANQQQQKLINNIQAQLQSKSLQIQQHLADKFKLNESLQSQSKNLQQLSLQITQKQAIINHLTISSQNNEVELKNLLRQSQQLIFTKEQLIAQAEQNKIIEVRAIQQQKVQLLNKFELLNQKYLSLQNDYQKIKSELQIEIAKFNNMIVAKQGLQNQIKMNLGNYQVEIKQIIENNQQKIKQLTVKFETELNKVAQIANQQKELTLKSQHQLQILKEKHSKELIKSQQLMTCQQTIVANLKTAQNQLSELELALEKSRQNNQNILKQNDSLKIQLDQQKQALIDERQKYIQNLEQEQQKWQKIYDDQLKVEREFNQKQISNLRQELSNQLQVISKITLKIQAEKLQYEQEAKNNQLILTDKSVMMDCIQKQLESQQSLRMQQVEQINDLTNQNDKLILKNTEHLQKIAELHKLIDQKEEELVINQSTSNEMLKSISSLRNQLNQKVDQNNMSTLDLTKQLKQLLEQKNKLEISHRQTLQNFATQKQANESENKSVINDLKQKNNSFNKQIQVLLSDKAKLQNQLNEKVIKIGELQHWLIEERQKKEKALQDNQFMEDIYKDFESRQTELTKNMQKIKHQQQLMNYFKLTLQRQFNKESINYLKNSSETTITQLKQIKQQLQAKQKESSIQKQNCKIELDQAIKISQHYENKYNSQKNEVAKLLLQITDRDKAIDAMTAQWKRKQLQMLNNLNKYQQISEKSKIELQNYKNKLNKKQSQVSKFTESISNLQSKNNYLKNSIEEKQQQIKNKQIALSNLKKDVEVYKGKMLDQNKIKIQEKQHYERQIFKLTAQIQKINIEYAQQVKKQLTAKEEQLKVQKQQLQQKYNGQLKKQRDQMDLVKKQKQEIEKELVNIKIQLIQEKKISARASAKLNQVTTDIGKLENLQHNNQEIQQKMTLKDQEIRKCFATIQSLKSTMSDLEDGIQTYQSLAEEKEREAEEQRMQVIRVQEEKNEIQCSLERLQRKIKETRLDSKIERFDQLKKPQIVQNKKQASILPLKMLFLKYFDPQSSYQVKIRTFNTLCQALSLLPKEMQVMNHYKRTKILLEVSGSDRQKKSKQSLQSKFLQFLTSE